MVNNRFHNEHLNQLNGGENNNAENDIVEDDCEDFSDLFDMIQESPNFFNVQDNRSSEVVGVVNVDINNTESDAVSQHATDDNNNAQERAHEVIGSRADNNNSMGLDAANEPADPENNLEQFVESQGLYMGDDGIYNTNDFERLGDISEKDFPSNNTNNDGHNKDQDDEHNS